MDLRWFELQNYAVLNSCYNNDVIIIERARLSEIPEIKRLLSETWIDTYGSVYSKETIQRVTTEWHSPDNLSSQIQNTDFYFGLAKENGKIIGLSTSRRVEKDSIFMYRLYVDPNVQRKGIGSKLLDETIKAFPEANTIKLEVEEKNYKAITFYTKMGFKESGKKVENVSDEKIRVIEMEKVLGE